MRALSVNPAEPREDRIDEAVRVLASGGIVALPTETFYGLAVDAGNEDALSAVQALKGKRNEPILLLLSDTEQLSQVAREVPPLLPRLAERFWPGPLTLVLRADPRIPDAISAGRGTVAVRVPGLGLPRRLAAALGRPVSGVSANRTGLPPARTAGEVARAFDRGLDLILDGGPSSGGAPSTILDLSCSPPAVVREGLVPLSALRPFLGPVVLGARASDRGEERREL
jgi:L-threonylcarbamoyladenylate synthase